jgi:hypothetical protein
LGTDPASPTHAALEQVLTFFTTQLAM